MQEKIRYLAEIISKVGAIKLPTPRSHFESLADSIVSQQLSTKAAATIFKRFVEAMEQDIRPGKILETSPEILRSVGLSGQKTKYMFALAAAFTNNPEVYENIHELSDQEVIKLLTEIKGIGVWTAQMFLMFNLLRENIFPIGDLGIRRSMEKHYFEGKEQPHELLIQQAEIWAPHRTVASFYFGRV